MQFTKRQGNLIALLKGLTDVLYRYLKTLASFYDCSSVDLVPLRAIGTNHEQPRGTPSDCELSVCIEIGDTDNAQAMYKASTNTVEAQYMSGNWGRNTEVAI